MIVNHLIFSPEICFMHLHNLFRSAAHVKLKLYDKAVQDARTAKQLKPDWPKVCRTLVLQLFNHDVFV